MNISAINNYNTNHSLAYKGIKIPGRKKVSTILNKTVGLAEDTTENPSKNQPFKIPEKVQKYAQKTYNFIIKVLDTF